MLIIRVELHSAITGKVTEIARMRLYNDGTGDHEVGNYVGETFRGRDKEALDGRVTVRKAEVKGYKRNNFHVWNLVAKMLKAMKYGDMRE
jgi:hypothetical protein